MPIDITNAPTHDITIAGHTFSVPAPFAEGYTLRQIDADVLNQTYAENIRNNFAAKVKAAIKTAEESGTELDLDALAAELAEYVSGYDFGVRRGGGGGRVAMSPVDKEAKRIAETHVKAALKRKGIAFKDVDKDDFRKIVNDVLEANPQIREQAAQIVEARQAIGEGALDIDLG